ncbi:MAG TPA: sigma factor-like helix-turn-helix DNA-binding protein, partial [Acidobacteriaceae bacterium]
GPGAESLSIAAESVRRILNRMDALPRKEREALLLSAVEELSTAEIAAVLSTSESSIRSRLFRARHALALMLANDEKTPRPGRQS